WDQDDDMGNSLPLEGGRWGLNGSRNVNALGFVPVNYDHSKGDTDDPSYGFRWSGKFGDVGYTLNYYHTLNDNPVVNSAFSGLPGVFAYGDAPTSAFGEFIFPEIDILGGSLNAYSRKLDVVFRGELAYTLDKPYNVGYAGSSSLTAFETGVLMLPAGSLPAGSLGIIEKDTARIMIGLDKTNLQTMRLLGTSQPSFLTFQLFDTWLPDFEDSEQLVNGSSKLHEHSVTGSVALGLNYKFDTVQPGAAFIYDFTNGGGAFVPSLNLIYGDHWRVKFTGTVYYQSDHTCGAADPTCTNSFGVFDDSDQVDVRVTYQF
ncbi:MAG: hypothetical protein J4A00_06930, partial [Gammaproteobacteria bacterium]|nr:hypothetical protein [Gammaproteobacteria bacterium]